jgi:hypothetical protein
MVVDPNHIARRVEGALSEFDERTGTKRAQAQAEVESAFGAVFGTLDAIASRLGDVKETNRAIRKEQDEFNEWGTREASYVLTRGGGPAHAIYFAAAPTLGGDKMAITVRGLGKEGRQALRSVRLGAADLQKELNDEIQVGPDGVAALCVELGEVITRYFTQGRVD